MKKISKKILFLFLIFFQCGGVLAISKKKQEESRKYYNVGVKFYLKRDFKKAAESWQNALVLDPDNNKAKIYFDKAQDKYYDSLKLYYDGLSFFKKREYDTALECFKNSLLINPLNERVKYFLKLCYKPIIKVVFTNRYFSVTANKNRFLIFFDKSMTVDNWDKSWVFIIEDKEYGIIQRQMGKEVPSFLEWDGYDINGNFVEKEGNLFFYMTVVSFFERQISSATDFFIIDTKGPELEVSSESNFSPDSLDGKNMFVHFKLKATDFGSGVDKIYILIYDSEKMKVLKEIKKNNNKITYKWDGRFDDGSKMVGGSTVYYKAVAFDKAGNKTESSFKKIDADIVLKKEDKGLVINLPNIEFAFGKATLRKSSYKILSKVGEILNRYNNAKFIIEGHTDNIGNMKRNMILSKKRAEAVFRYLNSKFNISKDRVQIKGYGPTHPIAPNDTEEGRKKNRRVEIVILTE